MYYVSAIESQRPLEIIAMESEVLSNMAKTLTDFFPDVLTNVKAGFSKLDNLKDFSGWSLSVFKSKEDKITDKLLEVPYTDLVNMKLRVPEGMIGNFLGYTLVLKELAVYNEAIEKFLNSYYLDLSAMITNKNHKISLHDKTRQYKEQKTSRDKFNTTVFSFFLKGSNDFETAYKNCFKNNTEVSEVFKNCNTLQDQLKQYDLNRVKGLVKKIISTQEILIKDLKENKNTAISPEVAKNISEGSYECGYQVEFLAINYYRTQSFLNAVEEDIERLSERLKRY